jgi:hypothetical protein
VVPQVLIALALVACAREPAPGCARPVALQLAPITARLEHQGTWAFAANSHWIVVSRAPQGRAVTIDGRTYTELPPARSFVGELGSLARLGELDARVLLEAIAVTGYTPMGPLEVAMTPDETAALAQRFPRVADMIAAEPAGFGGSPNDWHLRVYTTTPRLGAQCAVVSKLELAIVAGTVAMAPLDTRAVGAAGATVKDC